MYDVITICHYIAYYCHLKGYGYELTNLRLQKILYFLQLIFLDIFNRPCYNNKIEAWDLGPTVPDAYNHYRKYGAQLIPGDRTMDFNTIKDSDKKLIAFVISALSEYSTFQLIKITQKQKPWVKNYVSYDTMKIPIGDMKKFVEEMHNGKST